MSYLLDTNIISEPRRKRPNLKVKAWLAKQDATDVYLSVITLGEIQEGIGYLGNTKRAESLATWLEGLRKAFSGRILPVSEEVMLIWGSLRGEAKRAGRPLPLVDSLLAATALSYDLTLVTRNTKDFTGVGVNLLNPWGD